MLDDSQYSSAKKYEARIYLSRKFRTNPQSKYAWIFDHFPKQENLHVLELGCGTGLFWLANRNAIVPSWTILLSDSSEGMLETARRSLSRVRHKFQYEIIHAEDIHYPDNTFDIILANNMLYHIENRDATILAIGRILRDTGIFIASTMGKNDMLELHNCLYAFLESRGHTFRFGEYAFSLDNGMEQLNKHFPDVVLERRENKLAINEVDAM
jgi:ubiquinone/menaquinone biosynthesis C-methylase UbiE